jgi:hypothetical protein
MIVMLIAHLCFKSATRCNAIYASMRTYKFACASFHSLLNG